MKPKVSRSTLVLFGGIAILQVGCQMYRAPGSLLPSLAAAREDRSIAEYAQQSSFPSPAEVGLTSDQPSE